MTCAENEALWLLSVFPVQGGLFQMKKKLAKNECLKKNYKKKNGRKKGIKEGRLGE